MDDSPELQLLKSAHYAPIEIWREKSGLKIWAQNPPNIPPLNGMRIVWQLTKAGLLKKERLPAPIEPGIPYRSYTTYHLTASGRQLLKQHKQHKQHKQVLVSV